MIIKFINSFCFLLSFSVYGVPLSGCVCTVHRAVSPDSLTHELSAAAAGRPCNVIIYMSSRLVKYMVEWTGAVNQSQHALYFV